MKFKNNQYFFKNTNQDNIDNTLNNKSGKNLLDNIKNIEINSIKKNFI